MQKRTTYCEWMKMCRLTGPGKMQLTKAMKKMRPSQEQRNLSFMLEEKGYEENFCGVARLARQ